MKKEPVLIIMSVLAALQIVTAGTALADVVGLQAAGLAILIVGAVQAGMQFYLRGQVTPNNTVAAVVDEARDEVVAGQAAEPLIAEGEPVEVTPDDGVL